jgi:FkbH-like protein
MLQQVLRLLSEDESQPLPVRVRRTLHRAARYAKEVGMGTAFLRGCNEVGEGARVVGGRPRIENQGYIAMGARCCLLTEMGPLMLRAGPQGRLTIGESCIVNFGTLLSASSSVRIGNGVSIGQYCMVCDTESADAEGAGQPIDIADGVWLAARVTVLPGTRIGSGSVITAGSIVSGEIPAGVVAGGIPARVLRSLKAGEDAAAVSRNGVANGAGHAAAEPAQGDERTPWRRGVIVSDFTVGELERRLNDPREAQLLDFEVAPFGQVVSSLLSPPPEDRDNLIVWTRPEAVVPAFESLLAFESVPEPELLQQVDQFCDLLARAAPAYRTVLVPTWVIPPHRRTLGMLDARRGGATHALALMNLRLMDRLSQLANAFVLNAQRWVETAGRNAQQPKLWYMGKVPFHSDVFAEAALDVRAALAGVAGGARKLLILDLDDTLWGGIVGDVGYENLRLGGHDSLGEAFVDFQRAVKQLKRRGIVLALVSKNTESVALEAIRSHPEMVLREDDFVGWRINWNDKARNIAELVSELNLGLSAAVFIDDNPVERARVRDALPDVYVPEWPEDKLLYASTLRAIRCFDAPVLSREDADRTALYAAERRRDALKVEVGSFDDWLKSLQMEVRVAPLDNVNLARTTQLLNKTNQLNLRTRRLTEAELKEWLDSGPRQLFTFSVSDKFGDAGLTGIVGLEHVDGVTRIEDFVLSCRVMGRKVEETLAHVAVAAAIERGSRRVEAHYLETKKNKPCLEFFQRSGFSVDGGVYSWDTSEPYACPQAITLIGRG